MFAGGGKNYSYATETHTPIKILRTPLVGLICLEY